MLHNRGKVELVAGAGKTSQPHTLETMMRLQMCKTHLHFLAVVTRFLEGWCAIERTRMIASIFIYVARDVTLRGLRTTHGLERTGAAIIGARVIAPRVVRENTPRCLQ